MNYKINVGGRRGIVTCHVNLLKKYNRPCLFTAISEEGLDDIEEMNFQSDVETFRDVKINSTLTAVQKQEKIALCGEFDSVLTSAPGRTNDIVHEIRTVTEKPIRKGAYHIPHSQNQQVKNYIDEMIRGRLINVPSMSAYAAPIVPVAKRDGQLRITVDYRDLNKGTVFDAYPTPRIDEILDKVG